MRRLKVKALALPLLLLPAVAACAGGPPPPSSPAATVGAASTAQPEAEAGQALVEEAIAYTAIGKRDPFVSFFSGYGGVEGPGGDIKPTKLEKFDISQLKLVAVVTGISNPKAMVEAPDGKGYIIKRGTLIGKHRGRVTQIKREEIIITEEYRDATGRRVINQEVLGLPIEQLEKVE